MRRAKSGPRRGPAPRRCHGRTSRPPPPCPPRPTA